MAQLLRNRLLTGVLAWSSLCLLGGCSAYFYQPTRPRPARLGEETRATNDLRQLPPPKERIVAAVYKFRDQSGQYKPSDGGFNWSTAVTQGATNILLLALEQSNWFTPIERENVSNLLNERKIVRSSLAQYKNEAEALPPLLFAGVILEGGIVSYDANIITGGGGLRYFGAGGSTQYRQDRVTIYLRAVATKSGKILKTVYTSKTLLSQSIDAGLFRFVSFKRLLETETGFTTTEPSQMAVTEAIEKAVYALILEGIRDGLWTVDDAQAEAAKAALATYDKEKADEANIDVYGARSDASPARAAIHGYLGGWRYSGDRPNPQNKGGYGATVDVFLTPNLGVQVDGALGALGTRQSGFNLGITSLNANLVYRAFPYQRVNLLLYGGGGVVGPRRGNTLEVPTVRYNKVNVGLGVEASLNRVMGFRTTLEYNQPLSDRLDGIVAGRYNDYFMRATVGLTFKLGRMPNRAPRITPLTPPLTTTPATPAPAAK